MTSLVGSRKYYRHFPYREKLLTSGGGSTQSKQKISEVNQPPDRKKTRMKRLTSGGGSTQSKQKISKVNQPPDRKKQAQAAGMLEKDIIIEINGRNIEGKTEKEVKRLLREEREQWTFLLVDKEAYQHYKSQGINVSSSMREVISCGPGCESIDWSNFKKRKSDSGRYVRRDRDNRIMYHHYLPPANETEESTEEALSNRYEEFDTICHVTSLENAMQILKAGDFKLQKVSDNSVVTGCTYPLNGNKCQQPLHPVNNTRILWYGPWKKSNIGDPNVTVKRYGNVVFSMKTLDGYEGIKRYSQAFNYYYIEVIEYQTTSACRILVTRKTYSGLRVYDPNVFGGPWFISDGKCYYRKNCTLEIMREGSSDVGQYSWWLENHEMSFSYCVDPRHGVKAIPTPENVADLENNHLMQTLRLLFCLGEYRTFNKFSLQEDIEEHLYQGLKTLHTEAVKDFDDDENTSLDFFHDLMPGFKDMFMDTNRKVVEVYRLYLRYILRQVGDENKENVPKILGKRLGLI